MGDSSSEEVSIDIAKNQLKQVNSNIETEKTFNESKKKNLDEIREQVLRVFKKPLEINYETKSKLVDIIEN
eukprot:CAMPEP_0116902742 /NCGR_PEP_ID=MMETSP0467-20121206/10244_1 /TAXON_ID=283647 /ORGANISM="Mesodinium pulex, Strain SPMC105" /LENGTH=70 /DNA_ID=CAMNT_0004576733 /DNA_START=32 /DNA_END=244 /DNA_ORIENTATION=+